MRCEARVSLVLPWRPRRVGLQWKVLDLKRSRHWCRTAAMRCAHASRGGTFGSCRLTVCVARSFGSSCTREVDASGAVSHDVHSTRNRCNEKQTHRGESTNDATKHYVSHIPSCSVEAGLQCSRRLTGGLCSGLIPCSPTNVRRLALALLLLPVASHRGAWVRDQPCPHGARRRWHRAPRGARLPSGRGCETMARRYPEVKNTPQNRPRIG